MTGPFAVFDADGVFLQTKHPGNYLENRYGLSNQQTARLHERFSQYLVGKADLRDELPRFIDEWGLNVSAEDFFHSTFESGCEIDPIVAGVIKILRDRNVPCDRLK